MRGKHKGEKGLVTSVKEDVAYFYSDIQKREFKVFLNDCQLSSQASESLPYNADSNQYITYDLVVFSNKVGVVIASEKDSLKIVNE